MLNHSNTNILYRYKLSHAELYYSDKLTKSFIASLTLYRAFHKMKEPKAILNLIDFILKQL